MDVIVKLSGQIGVEVAAQGLATGADLEEARAAGCRCGQGPVLSPPLPPEHLEAYLDAARSLSPGPGSGGSGRPVPGRAGRPGTST
jgi:EAL domain-containing protein (putative c-di-GMP-specific phosphodiesterase class I)